MRHSQRPASLWAPSTGNCHGIPASPPKALKPIDGLAAALGTAIIEQASDFGVLALAKDPVTGSSHCILAPWWSEKLNATELLARQVSPRGGSLRIVIEGERVSLIGQAITVFEAELNLA